MTEHAQAKKLSVTAGLSRGRGSEDASMFDRS